MILNDLKDRFVIVARQGNSVDYAPNSMRALASAFPDADMIHATVTTLNNGVLVCSHESKANKLSLDEADDIGMVRLLDLMNWAKEHDKGLLLDPQSTDVALTQRIAGDARFFHMEDRVAVAARSLQHTKDIHDLNGNLGIVGVLRRPQQYEQFYKLGGHVATLRELETTPGNVRLAEAAEGRNRHPFWVLADEATVQGIFNACNGLTGAKGMIMRNPETGREALRQKGAKLPACAGFAPD